MSIQPRPEIVALTEAVHGSTDNSELKRLGVDPRCIIDFSVNVNPFGPSPRAVVALSQIPLDRYPDRESVRLRSVLANRLGVSEENLLAGNGSGELLYQIALAYIRPGDEVLIVGPTYAEYARSATAMGARCVTCNANVDTGFAVPVEAIIEKLRTDRSRVFYLCNPNNPTGQLIAHATIDNWAREFDRTLFVIDEAFIEFVPEAPSLADCRRKNVIVLRSLTKAYGLAGLRLGYMVGDPEVVRTLCRVRIPWSVNAAAQSAGVAAVQDEEHLERSSKHLHELKRTLVANLQSLGMNPLVSATPYFLIPVGDSCRLRLALIQSRILVRDCSSFGLPGFIRIGTRCPEDNAKLVDALAVLRDKEGLLDPRTW